MGLFEKSATIWWRAFAISGVEAGLGADCPACGSRWRYGIEPGQGVEHCGRVEKAPTDVHDLPCKSLKRGMPDLPKGYLMVSTWDDGNDWDADSAAKSDDPSAFEVGWI